MLTRFCDLNSLEALENLDKRFLRYIEGENAQLYEILLQYRKSANSSNLPEKIGYSNFLVNISPYFDDFIAKLFSIEQENLTLKSQQKKFDIIYECKRKFVQRILKNYHKKTNNNEKQNINFLEISAKLTKLIGKITEQNFAKNVVTWLQNPTKFHSELEIAKKYAIYLVLHNSSLNLFNIPRAKNPENLIRENRIQMLKKDIYLGFNYRDKEINLENALSQAKYCIYCHKQQKDSCRFGIDIRQKEERKEKKEKVTNSGCPLDQKISEMNQIMALGFNIAALGVIMIDNPLVAATGHRICNDCMKSCIFQKQDPVNIPLIESTILDNVLHLPYGVEIYILLTKWNPLNIHSPLPKKPTNYNVLVTGLGPAGFALSHYLLNEGHNVVAIDGLKINPLKFDITKPIKDYQTIKEPLSKRAAQGFGGVTEYGITSRWDKNNLTLIRLILERQYKHFKMIGGVRLGSNITANQAFDLGFNHIALCLGAGRPKYINSASYFFKGVKSAADFLMNLQQGGSYLEHSNSNLLIRLPVIVIGCGLTAIDSSVEAMHYYPRQVEKFLRSYENQHFDLSKLPEEKQIIAKEFIAHAKLLRKARSFKDKINILQKFGGVTICYRNNIQDSAAYKRNHEEIEHAKSIGVKFIFNSVPLETKTDKYNYVRWIEISNKEQTNIHKIAARTILVAIGTENNKFQDIGEFSSRNSNFSIFGDCNQKYSGSVVKALASAKDGYKKITKQLNKCPPKYLQNISKDFKKFCEIIDKQLKSEIFSIQESSNDKLPKKYIIDLAIKSQLAAKNYHPGQIFRLQNFSDNPRKTIKPIALSPYKVDQEQGLIYFTIAKIGVSTSLCANLKQGEKIDLMGPTGAKTIMPKSNSVILIGEGIRSMALLPIAEKLQKLSKKILFFGIYEQSEEFAYKKKIQEIIQRPNIFNSSTKINDLINIIKTAKIPKKSHIICYTKNKTLIKIKETGKDLFEKHSLISNILTPMQCMMKGICGKCIQKVNDENGYIFSCANQEYDINQFDPKFIDMRNIYINTNII